MAKSKLNRRTNPPAGPVQGNLDTLIQGVSQQPSHLRVIGQADEQINGWSSPVEGIGKRNPMRYIARIADTTVDNFFLDMMDVQEGEQYGAFLYPGDSDTTTLELWLNGQPVSVDVHGPGMSGPTDNRITIDSTGYLHNTTDLWKDYVLVNNGPIGFLVNRERFVVMDDELSPARENNGMVFVQSVAYEVTYTLRIDDTVVATYETPRATDDENTISTTLVATSLAEQVNALADYTAESSAYVVEVKRADGAVFTMKIDDGRSNTLARAFTDTVASLYDLPLLAPDDYVVNVSSDPSTTVDDRWLKFTTFDGAAIGEGSWSDALKPGIKFKLDLNTMPIVIFRAATGVLFIGPADGATRTANGHTYTFPLWGERTSGDEETVPNPDFIGSKLRDAVLFRSRAVVCGGQVICFSETDDVFNFFQDTSVALTATDPFALRASSEISSELEWLLPIDESILVFSGQSQFQVKAADADVLTPLTGMVLRLSNLEMNPNVRPKLAGAQVLFATNEFGYSHFREFSYVNTQQRRMGMNLGASSDTTINVPKYIKGLVTHWDVGEALDYAVASSPSDRKTLYIYKYLWQAQQGSVGKAQASWSKWRFSGDVQWVKFMSNELWIILTYPEGTYTCRIAGDELENIEEIQPHLDRLIFYPECNEDFQTTNDVTATYDAATDRTTFVLPYVPAAICHAVTRFIENDKEGLWLGSSETNTIVCNTKGDWTGYKIAFGEEYDFQYVFTKAYVPVKDQAKQRIVGDLEGRTQVLRWTTHHCNTGYYSVKVKRKNRSIDSVHEYRARNLNVSNNALDTEAGFLGTGSFKVPVCSKNVDCTVMVESNSWLPLVITGASWEGAFSNRAKRLN